MNDQQKYSDSHINHLVGALLAADDLPPIVQAGNPVLRAVAQPFDGQLDPQELSALIDLMRRTMQAAPGVGLAAPQVGIPLQLAVLEDQYEISPDITAAKNRHQLDFFAILNPSYEQLGPELASHYEGCLSMSGWQAVVERPALVSLKYDDVAGNTLTRHFSGWQARIVQHETDHLSGTLYIDKAKIRSLSNNAEFALHHSDPDLSGSREILGF